MTAARPDVCRSAATWWKLHSHCQATGRLSTDRIGSGTPVNSTGEIPVNTQGPWLAPDVCSRLNRCGNPLWPPARRTLAHTLFPLARLLALLTSFRSNARMATIIITRPIISNAIMA